MIVVHFLGGEFCTQCKYVSVGAFLDECAQGECANAGTFQLLSSTLKLSECSQDECANGGKFFGWLFLPNFLESAQCECTNVPALFGRLYVCPNFQSASNLNVLMLAEFLGV